MEVMTREEKQGRVKQLSVSYEKQPPAALPGAKLLKSLINRSYERLGSAERYQRADCFKCTGMYRKAARLGQAE
ncbi:hypothetical protein [Desulfoluna butyratoxydans]|uniref:hypothetical protein n=1 Tax=Desulfoluna butyratoxydans TaxID=231438 RepID=UPI0015D118C5|nr:hypothetical protein [Desulfoluna butyratoxydans]